jgi:DNA-binding LacI/PurR family transcriptional regulator
MRQVAAEAGVGVMTVSYTYTRPDRVAPATRARVQEAAARLGYRGPDPTARSLRRGKTGNLGVVFGEYLTYAFEDPQAARFLAGVSSVCVTEKLGLTLIPTSGDPGDIDRVSESAVDGFVIWTTTADDPVLDAVAATGRPAAVQGGPARPGIAVVSADDEAAAHAIAAHMLQNAVSPLVLSQPTDADRSARLVRGPDPEVPFPVTRNRLAGFRRAFLEADRDWAEVPVAIVSRNTREDARAATAAALEQVQPDVVIAMSDQLAAGAIDVLGESARVSGWDDGELASSLGFSSIRQSLFDQGAACARIAAGLETDADPAAWELVVR